MAPADLVLSLVQLSEELGVLFRLIFGEGLHAVEDLVVTDHFLGPVVKILHVYVVLYGLG